MVKQIEQKGDDLKITLNGSTGDTTFEGKFAQQGPGAGKILGIYHFRGEPLSRAVGEDNGREGRSASNKAP